MGKQDFSWIPARALRLAKTSPAKIGAVKDAPTLSQAHIRHCAHALRRQDVEALLTFPEFRREYGRFFPEEAQGQRERNGRQLNPDQGESLIDKLARMLGVDLDAEDPEDEPGVQVIAEDKPKRSTRKGSGRKAGFVAGTAFVYVPKGSTWEILHVNRKGVATAVNTESGRESTWKVSTLEKLAENGKVTLP